MKAVKEELLRWTCKTHATNSYLDRRILRQKALELSRIRGLNGFKCSEKWLTSFLRNHGFSYDLADRTGPTFVNYRDWIDLMRPTIIKYNHNDLFHVDELTMYTDILPSAISSEQKMERSLGRNRVTILMGCNSSGSVKLPLLICGSYPSGITSKEHAYSNSEESYIDDESFRNWLSSVNERMFKSNRRILMFLRRNRAQALKGFAPSNLKLVYLPENFPPLLRPLRKEVFHYIKMIFRRKYAERLKRNTTEWSLQDILKTLNEAWKTIPREIIVFGFQRTHFRTDNSFLQIDCDCWDSSKMGISFKRFVTFDDKLSDAQPFCNPTSRIHGYNLRTNSKDTVRMDTSDPVTENVEVLKEEIPSMIDPAYRLSSELRDRRKNAEKKPGKRSYSETRFKTCLRSIHGKTVKREAEPQRQSDVESRESLKAIVDKALTLTSLVNAEYTKKLIDSIRASLQEITAQTSHAVSSGNDPETKRRRMKGDTRDTLLNFTCLKKGDQPSTSKDRLKSLPGSARGVMETNEGVFKGTADLDEESSVSNFKRKTGKVSEEDSSIGEPSEKKSKVDHDWSKQFETTFVFGSQNSDCSKGARQDGSSIVDSGVFNVTPSISPRD